jgi:hypothetical protein
MTSLIETNSREHQQQNEELNNSCDFNMIASSNLIETSVIALAHNTSYIQTISHDSGGGGGGSVVVVHDENMSPMDNKNKSSINSKDSCNVKVAIRYINLVS